MNNEYNALQCKMHCVDKKKKKEKYRKEKNIMILIADVIRMTSYS